LNSEAHHVAGAGIDKVGNDHPLLFELLEQRRLL
jgi:hypothetical protein